jgi:hypothetical protein
MKQFFLFCLFVLFVFAFDESKFEKCEQKAFCKRLRNQERTFYENVRGSKHTELKRDGSVFELNDKVNSFRDPILTKITAYEKGIFRIQISEKTEGPQVLKHRNEAKDVLDKYALKVNAGQQESNLQGTLSDDYNFHFEESPWRANLVHKNQKVLIFNAESTLTVENQFRQKGEQEDVKTNSTKNYGLEFRFKKKKMEKQQFVLMLVLELLLTFTEFQKEQ